MKSRGLGDSIEKFTKATGIKTVVKKVVIQPFSKKELTETNYVSYCPCNICWHMLHLCQIRSADWADMWAVIENGLTQ